MRTESHPELRVPRSNHSSVPSSLSSSGSPSNPGKSILRYPGGKTRAIRIILPQILAQSANRFISPFFGGGSIEFAWAKANPNGIVLGTDLYPPVVVFWQQVLKDSAAIADAVQTFLPLQRDRFYELQKQLPSLEGSQLAAAFYVLNRASFSGATMSGGMSPGHRRFTQSSIDRLRRFAAPNVSVQYGSAFDVLSQLLDTEPADTVIYLDPPYKLDESSLYGERGNTHKQFDHEAFARLCRSLSDQGHRFVISYNDKQAIRGFYPDLRIETATWAYGMKNIAGTPMGESSEILIFSKAWNHLSDR